MRPVVPARGLGENGLKLATTGVCAPAKTVRVSFPEPVGSSPDGDEQPVAMSASPEANPTVARMR